MKIPNIDLDSTLFCGQCFRSTRLDTLRYLICSGTRQVIALQVQDGVVLKNINESDLPYWHDYFCADTDYAPIISQLSQDATLAEACAFAPGLRLLKQKPFETLISFIISQNNNIPRIAGIIEKLCVLCGDVGDFPEPQELARFTEADLSPLRAGYRARYILDAAKKVNSGEISLDKVEQMGYNRAKQELMRICGVGSKVADCALLYGFGKLEAFPRDVWVERAMEQYYPQTLALPECAAGCEGIAQLFLFHYIRNIGGNHA
ncbi:MAG: DNA-3-methyladenine glycosylase 2 [Oscillospiraceae bacterium]|nr:DNA-3-methyladenine glycosylase 2 [Oscillospiraceae bacterium]